MWFVPFTIRDFIDILLVALIMYWLYRSTRGTNAPFILTGVISIYMLWVMARALNMELLSSIFGQVISVGVIALIVVYQPEIRRFLNVVANRQHNFGLLSRLFKNSFGHNNREIRPIIEASSQFSRARIGTLIVISQLSDLTIITKGGVEVDAKLSTPLLSAIFSANSPLRDGALVVKSGRVVAAKCTLPTTQSDTSMSMDDNLKAALGLSEVSDAIVIITSEHTGEISIAKSGQLTRDLSADELARELFVTMEAESSNNDGEVAQ